MLRSEPNLSESTPSLLPAGRDLALAALPVETPDASATFASLAQNLAENLRFLASGFEFAPEERELLDTAVYFLAAGWVASPRAPEAVARALLEAWQGPGGEEVAESGRPGREASARRLESLLRAGFRPADDSSGVDPRDATLADLIRDAVTALDAKKDPEDLFLRRPSPPADVAHSWFARELERLRGLRFRTLAGTIRFGKRLEKNIEDLAEAQARFAQDGFTAENQKTTLSLYRSISRNMIDMITLADRKAGLLLNANAISLTVLLSFFGKDLLSDRSLWLPSILVAGTCAATVVFASLAAQPIRRRLSSVSLADFRAQGLSFLHYGDVARLSRADFLRGFHAAAREGQRLEENMLSELHFFALRITEKFRMVRRAYVTMIGGILLACVAFVVTHLGK